MPLPKAVVFVDRHCAKILQFGPEVRQERKVNAQMHLNGQDERNAHTKQEFLGKVCDGLEGVDEVLVVGGHTGITDFKQYAQSHRPEMATHIAGYAPVEHASGNELEALARQWFTHNTH